MRNISFALTTQQIRERTKTVTRRLGWRNVRPGDLLQACVKCQGLKKGEHPEKICVIRVTRSRPEPLCDMTTALTYGKLDVKLEGFPEMTPEQFVEMFCKHNKCTPWTVVTRIGFEYVP